MLREVVDFPPQNATFARRTDAKLRLQRTVIAMREGPGSVVSEATRHALAMVKRYGQLSDPRAGHVVERMTKKYFG